MTIRVAAIRDGRVETVMAAPDEIADAEAYGLWAHPLLIGPFAGCELRALRDDTEGHVTSGMLFDGSAFTAPPTPIEEQIERVNAQATAQIFAGYEFRGARFSMSQNAQANMQYLLTLALNAPQLLGLPITMPNIDDTVFLDLVTVEDVVAMAMAMAMHKRTAIDACTVVKKAVQAGA